MFEVEGKVEVEALRKAGLAERVLGQRGLEEWALE
jgi:hypothetical protein